jgi:hypothetical protein
MSPNEDGLDQQGTDRGPDQGMIGGKAAFALYAVLVALVFILLHGKALALGLIIVGGLAAKSLVEHLRRRTGVK